MRGAVVGRDDELYFHVPKFGLLRALVCGLPWHLCHGSGCVTVKGLRFQ